MKKPYRVIDSHQHLYNWYDSDGTDFMTLLDRLQKNTGLDALCLLSCTVAPYGNVEQNILPAIYKLHNPTAYAEASIVYPSTPAHAPFPAGMDLLTQYREIRKIGFDGIKILFKPDSQKLLGLPMNDPYYNDFFAAAEADGFHFTWHVGDPAFFWRADVKSPWDYSDGSYMPLDEMYRQVFDILERYPRLNISFAHFFFMSEEPERLIPMFEKYENVGIDLTPGTEMYSIFMKDPERYRNFITKYADRITFGSDAEVTTVSYSESLVENVYTALATEEEATIWGAHVRGIGLPSETCQKIFHDTHCCKIGAAPRPIDRDALCAYIRKYEKYILGKENHRKILEFCQENG